MSTKEMITLDNLGGGAASEMFQGSLEKVIENIVNPNTKAEAVRTITLKVKIKPTKKDRSLCTVELSCDEKVAAVLPFETAMFVGMQHGVAAATEYAPQQGQLFDEPKKNNMIAIAGGK